MATPIYNDTEKQRVDDPEETELVEDEPEVTEEEEEESTEEESK